MEPRDNTLASELKNRYYTLRKVFLMAHLKAVFDVKSFIGLGVDYT